MFYYLNLFLGSLALLTGLALYFWAPRKGPNSWLGIRLSYTFQSREVWDRVNRNAGKALILAALSFLALAFLLSAGSGVQGAFTFLWLALVLAFYGRGLPRYARKVAQETVMAPRLPELPLLKSK